jgi:hypothetical protein
MFDLGAMTLPVDNFLVPNGLAFSTDGVSNHGRQPSLVDAQTRSDSRFW